MIFQKIGTIQIDEDLTLTDPKMQMMMLHYNMINNTFTLVIEFWEIGYRHQRTFFFTNPTPNIMTMDMIMTELSKHPVLNQFISNPIG